MNRKTFRHSSDALTYMHLCSKLSKQRLSYDIYKYFLIKESVINLRHKNLAENFNENILMLKYWIIFYITFWSE